MKHRLTYLTALAAALLLASCTNDNDGTPAPAPQTGNATFRISTRAGQQGPPAGQHAALYVAERRPESSEDELYCTAPAQDLGSGAYLLEDMTAQWYKLAFVCAPQAVVLKKDVAEGDAFNDITLDYSGFLGAMEDSVRALAIGGTAVWVGGVCPQDKVRLDSEQIIRRLLTIKGLHNYNAEDFHAAVDFILSHYRKYPFAELIYDSFPLEQAEEAFQYAIRENPYRVGIRMTSLQ